LRLNDASNTNDWLKRGVQISAGAKSRSEYHRQGHKYYYVLVEYLHPQRYDDCSWRRERPKTENWKTFSLVTEDRELEELQLGDYW
jgi:hypothetical protein